MLAERFSARIANHGEAPFWDSMNGRLLCADVLAARIVAVDRAERVSFHTVPSSVIAVIRRRVSGGFVIGTERGIVIADEQLCEFKQIAEVTDEQSIRNNDGGCDPLGAFFVGTMAYDERPGAGGLFRMSPDGEITKVLSSVSISNGIQWSADGTTVYYIDSPTRRVDAFDVDPFTGNWSGRRPHIHIGRAGGVPDGMAIDEEDGLWIALWGSGEIKHFDREGRLVQTIRVPGVTQVSSCAFGGDDRSTLFITTSRLGLQDGQEPNAGSLFAVATSSRGAVQREFAG